MAAKFFIICAQAFLMQSVYSQCLGRFGPGPLAGSIGSLGSPLAGSLAAPLAYDSCGGVASTGGGFPVTSASPIAPTGVSLVSENAIEGALSVGGNLPLLGSVAVDGAFPTGGAGAVSYGCGNDAIGITSESPIATGILAPGPVAPAPALSAAPALARSSLVPGLAGTGFAPGLAGNLATGRFGARAGIAPGIGLGCGCGAKY